MLGLENCKELFGLASDKDSISAAFEVNSSKNLLFGGSGLLSRTLEHWEALLKDASKLIESLRAELFKSRAEKEQAESERIHAALKLAQMQSKLDDAKNALDAMAKDRRAAVNKTACCSSGVLQFETAEPAGCTPAGCTPIQTVSISPLR